MSRWSKVRGRRAERPAASCFGAAGDERRPNGRSKEEGVMRWSRFLKGAVVVSMAAAVVGIPAIAQADIKATFDVHPNLVAAKSTTTFHLSWLNMDGATTGKTADDNPQCIVFTLGDGATNFSGLSSPGAVKIGGATSNWTGVVDNSATPPTLTVSGT